MMLKDDPALYIALALTNLPKSVRSGLSSKHNLERQKAVDEATAAIVETLRRQFELKFTATAMRYDIAPGGVSRNVPEDH